MRPRAALVALLLGASALAQQPAPPEPPQRDYWADLRAAIDRHLGKPYVWGATGRKSFDCSGFLWRVMTDTGVFIKRTTARRYYMCLPKPGEDVVGRFGTVVFFSDLEHVGIVNDRDTFFHAACTRGTHQAAFDPYWRRRIVGYRAIPAPAGSGSHAAPSQPGALGSGATPTPAASPAPAAARP
ncbi:MAG: C40 family peptidase [Acidobacteriota bacterium]